MLLVSRVAGHSRPSLTLDVYSQLFGEELADAAVASIRSATTKGR